MTRGPVNSVHVTPVNYIYSSLGQQVHSSSVPCLCPVDKLGQFGDVTVTRLRDISCMHVH